MIHFTLNENCRGLEGYPALFMDRIEHPYFLHVVPQGCVSVLKLTPGHFVEEDEIVERFGLK